MEKDKLCPVCGQPNMCALANNKDPKTCWCMSIESIDFRVTKENFDQCLCENCLRKRTDDNIN